MTQKPHPTQSGFTLLEVAVILAIVTMLLGFYLSFYKPMHEANATMETRQKIDRVLNALARHAMANATGNRLPCPGNPTAPNGLFGSEDGGSGVCGTAGTPGMGVVPYRALGLSQEDVQDGFGRYLTYIVTRAATAATGTPADSNASYFCITRITPLSNPSDITLFRNGGAITQADRPVAVVMSHGPDGTGSLNVANSSSGPYGDVTQLGGTAVTGERGNAVNATIGATSGRLDIDAYDTRPGAAHFDDIIGYMTGSDVASRLSVEGCH